MWDQKDLEFKPDFLQLLREQFRAPLERLDFIHETEKARVNINRWAAAQTHDRIRDILKPGDLNQLTRLVLTNAVYLKAEWAVQFKVGATTDRPFTTPGGKITTKMMHHELSFRYARAAGVQLVELPYRGGLSMVVVLPDAVHGLDAVEAHLAGSYQRWLKALDYKLIDLQLPRWTAKARLPLGETLAAMGMPTAFTEQADFTGMAVTRPLFIHKVLQQAFVDVNEAGTEAAAVTAIVERTASASMPTAKPVVFHADHPFLYLIRDTKTGVILFIGRVIDPR